MKNNKKLFLMIYISIVSLFLICLIVFIILGKKERIGYLDNINLNIYDTIKTNFIYTNNLNIKDNESLKEYILTNDSINNYVYNFRISYYDKVFRNSDIYGVYLVNDSLPKYIKEVIINKKGSPFGTFISSKIIAEEEKIDNASYILKVKIIIYFIIPLFTIAYLLFLFLLNNKSYIIIFIFLCFLILPNIIYTLFGNYFDKNNYENRNKTDKPKLLLLSLIDYPKEYENYFNDYLPFRNELIKLKNKTDVAIFKNIISDKVLLGKNNWLFAKFNKVEKYIGLDLYKLKDKELESAKNNLLYFRDEFKKRNIDFVFMICPDKETIYPEYMPNYIKKISALTSTDQLIDYIKKNTDIKIVYPKDELIKYKDKYQLYYKYDAHWNNLGGYIGYKELMNNLKIDVPRLEDLNIIIPNKNVSGDLAGMVNLQSIYSDDIDYVLTNYSKNTFYIKEGTTYHRANSTAISDSTNNNNIYLIRDSFSSYMYDYIASYYAKSRILSIYFVDDINNYINEIISEKPNLVVIQTVERRLIEVVLDTLSTNRLSKIK